MQPEIYHGFTVYKKNYGPVWVALHSGPAIRPTTRDDNSDTIANICWEKSGGTMILSNMPRDVVMGVDFNRELPNAEIALEYYQKLVGSSHGDEKRKYKSRYAFVAATKKAYHEKAKIYNSLWSCVRSSGDFIVFLHRQLPRMRSYPSAIDFITFNDIGIKREVMKKIVDDINSESRMLFRKMEKNFKNITYIEQMKKVNIFGIKSRYVMDDIKIIGRYCDTKIMEKAISDFNEHNFLAACSSALKNMPPPEITMERVFSAEKAIGPKKEIIKNMNKVAIEVEVNEFMSGWHPKETAKIIMDMVDKIRKVDECKKMGFNQKQILEFIS